MSDTEKTEMKLTPVVDVELTEGNHARGETHLLPYAQSNNQPTYRSALPMTVGAVAAGVVALAFPQIHATDLGLFALATMSVCLAASLFLRRCLGATWRFPHLGVRTLLFLASAGFGFALASVCIGLSFGLS